jgi:hypothetical protein
MTLLGAFYGKPWTSQGSTTGKLKAASKISPSIYDQYTTLAPLFQEAFALSSTLHDPYILGSPW